MPAYSSQQRGLWLISFDLPCFSTIQAWPHYNSAFTFGHSPFVAFSPLPTYSPTILHLSVILVRLALVAHFSNFMVRSCSVAPHAHCSSSVDGQDWTTLKRRRRATACSLDVKLLAYLPPPTASYFSSSSPFTFISLLSTCHHAAPASMALVLWKTTTNVAFILPTYYRRPLPYLSTAAWKEFLPTFVLYLPSPG